MTRKYTNFTEKEMADGTYVVAEPRHAGGERVRLEAGWFDGDEEDEAEFERVVSTMVKQTLTSDGTSITDGDGALSRSDAKQALLESDGDEEIGSEARAEALIDYFAEEGVFDLEDGQLHVLEDMDTIEQRQDSETKKKRILNWAAALDAGIQKIEDTKESFEQSREKLESYLKKVDTSSDYGYDERKQEIGRELMQLGDGEGFPDRSDLSAEEKTRYDTLKRQWVQAKKMAEVGSSKVEQVERAVEQMVDRIGELERAQGVYDSQQSQMRLLAFHEEQRISGMNEELARELVDMTTLLGGSATVEEDVADMDEDDFEDEVMSEISDTEAFAERFDEATEEMDHEDEQATEFEL